MWEEGYLSAGARQLHYLRSGAGSRLLLAFHGYGDDAGLFQGMAPYLEEAYTIVSVSLPHHGQSRWPEAAPFTQDDLVSLVEGLLRASGRERLSLAGYSLGGRVCLMLLELMPERLERVLLLAPDGLAPNRLYYFATRAAAGRTLFRRFLEGDGRHNRWIDWLHRCGLLSSVRYKFVMRHVGTEAARRFLLQVWPAMCRLLPDSRKVRRNIRRYHIPVHIFMGRDDRIIPPRAARSFGRGLPEVQVTVLEEGHYLFRRELLREITRCLL